MIYRDSIFLLRTLLKWLLLVNLSNRNLLDLDLYYNAKLLHS